MTVAIILALSGLVALVTGSLMWWAAAARLDNARAAEFRSQRYLERSRRLLQEAQGLHEQAYEARDWAEAALLAGSRPREGISVDTGEPLTPDKP